MIQNIYSETYPAEWNLHNFLNIADHPMLVMFSVYLSCDLEVLEIYITKKKGESKKNEKWKKGEKNLSLSIRYTAGPDHYVFLF